MTRLVKVPSDEKGDMGVFIIRSKDGVWEGDWDYLRGTPMGNLFSQVTQQELDHILRGYSKPFVAALGISPEGALRKLPGRECDKRKKCPFHDANKCHTLTKKELPWCFEPEGLDLPPEVAPLAFEAVFQWRAGVYLVVVDA